MVPIRQLDGDGLSRQDRAYLAVLGSAEGVPLGLDTLAAHLGVERRVVADIIEPYLLRTGQVRRTPRGRAV